MEVVRRVVLCCGCLLGLANVARADGFFRRVPEVGEWARYDLVIEVSTASKDGQIEIQEAASHGGLTLRCVGEETIDDVPHLWLEARFDLVDYEGSEHWAIAKVLVQADQIVEGGINAHIVRGWSAADTEEPRALILDGGKFDQEPSAFNLMIAFPDSHISAGQRAAHTVTVAGEEIELAHCETGDVPRREFAECNLVGEATWWPNGELAFGVAAAEQAWTSTMPDQPEPILMTLRMNLAETGTDAESDLPDNN
jgi:hypothetical protein